MEHTLKEGLQYTAMQKVMKKDTASEYGSGFVEVFATPAMIALMENAALKTVLPHLPKGYNTVGFAINIKHLKPTPVGMEVQCTARLISIEGKKLSFEVEAFDQEGKIGAGTHIRYIINNKKFMENITS